MEAPAVFDNILQQIQTSNWNFKLELSPFSANISIKKSFIRNKAGTVLHPQCFSGFYRRDEKVDQFSVIDNYEAK
jgi:hypothetical protein